MFIPSSFIIHKKVREKAALARILPPTVGKYLLPKHTLSYDQIKLHLYKESHFLYEVLFTIDPTKLSHIPNLTSELKVKTIGSFLDRHYKYKVYGVFESPHACPTNLHFHGILSIYHKSYDPMYKKLRLFLRDYGRSIGRYSCIRINSSTEEYQPSESISTLGASRKVGNLSKYVEYINKSLRTLDSHNTYHNSYIRY